MAERICIRCGQILNKRARVCPDCLAEQTPGVNKVDVDMDRVLAKSSVRRDVSRQNGQQQKLTPAQVDARKQQVRANIRDMQSHPKTVSNVNTGNGGFDAKPRVGIFRFIGILFGCIGSLSLIIAICIIGHVVTTKQPESKRAWSTMRNWMIAVCVVVHVVVPIVMSILFQILT